MLYRKIVERNNVRLSAREKLFIVMSMGMVNFENFLFFQFLQFFSNETKTVNILIAISLEKLKGSVFYVLLAIP